MRKNILKKLMGLESPQANHYLANLAKNLDLDILNKKTNEDIYKSLVDLEEFVYKVPGKALSIIKQVIQSKPKGVKIEKTEFGNFPGKSHEDLILKCINLLERLRYIKPKQVFNILVKSSANKNEQVRKKSLEIIGKQIEYNFNILKKAGYVFQREILDIVLGWNHKKQEKNIEVVKKITEQLLEPSFGGTSAKDYQTLVFHRGALGPTSFLSKMRKDLLRLIFDLVSKTKDLKIKLGLVKILRRVADEPDVGSKENLKQWGEIVESDIGKILSFYQKLVFGDKKSITAELPIVYEIEEQLSWFKARHKQASSKTDALLKKIRGDKGVYSVYRLLTGSPMDFRSDEGWDEVGKKREKEIAELLEFVNSDKVEEWAKKLAKIASYQDFIEEWKVIESFSRFLIKLANKKPSVADKIIDHSFIKKTPLINFSKDFLYSFRNKGQLEFWDKYVKEIKKTRDIKLLRGIVTSFRAIEQKDVVKNVRKEDIDLLCVLIQKQTPFAYLKRGKNEASLHYNTLPALIHILPADKKRIQSLIIKEIKNYPELSYLFARQLDYGVRSNSFDLSRWNKKHRSVLLLLLIEIKSLEHDGQMLLLALAKNYFEEAMEVFLARIKKDKKKSLMREDHYTAIPGHLNPDLLQCIQGHSDYKKVVRRWVQKMTDNWSVYNFRLAQLLQKIGGDAFQEIIKKLIKTGQKKNLKKVIKLFKPTGPPDFDICFKIVERTDDRKIWKALEGRMHNTGVVTGEHGLSNAYKNKLVQIQKKHKETNNTNVKTFTKEFARSLKSNIAEAKKREDEELAQRKLEFDS